MTLQHEYFLPIIPAESNTEAILSPVRMVKMETVHCVPWREALGRRKHTGPRSMLQEQAAGQAYPYNQLYEGQNISYATSCIVRKHATG